MGPVLVLALLAYFAHSVEATAIGTAVLCNVRQYRARQRIRGRGLNVTFFVQSFRAPEDNQRLAQEMAQHRDVVRFARDDSHTLFARVLQRLAQWPHAPAVWIVHSIQTPFKYDRIKGRIERESNGGQRLVYGGRTSVLRGQTHAGWEFVVVSHSLLDAADAWAEKGKGNSPAEVAAAMGADLSQRDNVRCFHAIP